MRSSTFDSFNHTELYQTCMRMGFHVRPNESRETMIAYIEGETDPPEIDESTHVIHLWRHGIIGFLLDHWKSLATQITCPARFLKHPQTPNPKPCFGCLDTQVITCLVMNKDHERLIEPHRLKKETERK